MSEPVHPEYTDWAPVPAAVVSDSVGRFGAMAGTITALSGRRLVGPAHTLRLMAGDNRAVHLELPEVEPGWVLVIDGGGYLDRAVWGGVLTEAAMRRRIAGVVIDGAVRDIEEIRQMGFPVFARGTSPAGPHKAGGGVGATTISCGGVPVSQGDLVVGDLDGVSVVPRAEIRQTLTAATARLRDEQEWIRKIRSGVPSSVALGLQQPQE